MTNRAEREDGKLFKISMGYGTATWVWAANFIEAEVIVRRHQFAIRNLHLPYEDLPSSPCILKVKTTKKKRVVPCKPYSLGA